MVMAAPIHPAEQNVPGGRMCSMNYLGYLAFET